ncbi:threonylcarbamoyl-AMP synthase [Sphingomonas sp. CGMCC 1.13654]|uniref:Threonylcarbamoyl-AMP synthase n=1 Tax=Sphingomonas chungangi TaxID=2683589 RepID=A0A838LCA9_9SPHN|nr:L-threonylcarbamoyladenylate synthase [Sphingomonas chungangi]MBA2935776.1 threonylcarbamoyl-AMP synthase [Sphingomonas chungangi]MVW54467.1 threonylcarbamoyl-AMP synthase [Sphingomonas chungangi]
MILPLDDAAIARAADLIRAGQPVAVPTETVYGLAADATSGEAVARIYAAKGRPSFNPLIVHVASMAQAETLAVIGPVARRLADAFWPGPLTMVLPLGAGSPVSSLVTAGLPTLALRMPAHPAMKALIEASGRPLAAPSANASGRISATRAEHVASSLGDRVPLVLDGGPTRHGIESTIVAVEPERLRLLRPGPITAEHLSDAGGLPVDTVEDGRIEAPGQLSSHYAPGKPVRLEATGRLPGEWLIGFGPIEGDDNLSPIGDPIEAAARLFDALHRADAAEPPAIAIAPIPRTGLGHAINDRLKRAAAPR